MTFAEIIFFVLFVAAIYRLLRPLQWRVERWIFRKLGSKKRGSPKPPIDITDYKKNN
jgi:hypothetical protein